MATDAQFTANRQNAQSSTGPRTEAGHAASSRNALTLGLYTRTDYVRPEEHDLYKEVCETLYSELDPEGLLEQTFVSEITGATWRLRRCDAAEASLVDFDESTDKIRRSIERARAHAHSVLHRSVNQLRRIQTDRACRLLLNAEGDGLRDYKQVLTVKNNYERGKRLHLEAHLASICNTPEAESASICKTPEPTETKGHSAKADSPEPPRNSPCPCNSGKKYKACCARQGPGWPTLTKVA